MPNLSIRNVTNHSLELVSAERFAAERVKTVGMLSSIGSAVSNFLNATESASSELRVKADLPGTDRRDVSFRADAFQTVETDVAAAEETKDVKEVVRLTFKIDDRRYETDVPSPSSRSAVMQTLDDGPLDLTVVYVPKEALVAVYSSARLESWMGTLRDEWPLPSLSVPGTHNSPTCYTALPSVRCQAVGVPEQLRNGVRFMDIRVSASKDDDRLALVHSVFPISLTGTKWFADMLEDVYKFLDEQPSETVIISLKREGTGKGSDGDLGRYLKNAYVGPREDKWYTEPRVPTLGEVRGKIVLMRRFGLDDDLRGEWDGQGWGLDASAWPDNCEDGEAGSCPIRVQDFYEITESDNIDKKVSFSHGHLERAGEHKFLLPGMDGYDENHKPPFYVNFLSASNFFNATCWPERIAAKVNPRVVDYLCTSHGVEGKGLNNLSIGSAGAGIVVTDWVGANGDWDLVRCIVGMNARLQN
ncbi:hypothetical protein PWT90_02728 [Aphanocladium album]|nr:hypothetical protein PWT90_02728 [Aphanocladium album]